MNVEKLKQLLNEEFKSLKQLCEIINIEYKDSTDSRKKIIKEIGQYVKSEKIGRKIKIIEIYENI